MPLDTALLELKDRLQRLAAALVVMKKRLADGCPDESHYLVGRMQDAVTAATGWLRKARQAVRQVATEPTEARKSLAKFDHVFGKLRQELRRDLIGPQRLADLTDLGQRKTEWGEWVAEVLATAAELRRATTATARALHACWRELAGQPSPAVVVNNTVALGRPRRGGRTRS